MTQDNDRKERVLDPQAHVLAVDDDLELRSLLVRYLRQHGFKVSSAGDGQEMWRVFENGGVDLIVLDLMLPGVSGLDLCRQLRARSGVPIIMLTARSEDADRIVGLEMGADDYVPKPFNPRELVARIRAVLRRFRGEDETRRSGGRTLNFMGWRLDLPKRELLSPDGVVVDLSGAEFDLLLVFAEHPQRVLTRDQLLDLARNRVSHGLDRSIDVQVSRLRRKIERSADGGPMIKTVRGAGYIFTPSVSRS